VPAPLPAPPFDHNLLRQWIERVPTLRLDGEIPTPHELADRLGAFWYPDQTVLYVGRTSRSLGQRLEGYYRTPLGDPRPHAGGHWLKTLRDLGRCLVWWAESDADEEYEDAVLGAFERAVDPAMLARLYDPTVVVPFANLQTAGGLRKEHGISGALLPADAVPESSSIQRSDRKRSKPRPTRAGSRPAGAGGGPGLSGDGRARRTAAKGGSKLPPPARVHLSTAGLDALHAELDDLRAVKRPDVVARIRAARELGDLSENADYEIARHDQSFIEGRIRTLEDMIERASIIDQVQVGDAVHFGSTVVLDRDGQGAQERFTIVGPAEANPREGRISHASPIGQALLGKRAGDEVVVTSPGGDTRYRIVEIA
jgi:transcription elongation factor GreA